jgi:hypothetical protein
MFVLNLPPHFFIFFLQIVVPHITELPPPPISAELTTCHACAWFCWWYCPVLYQYLDCFTLFVRDAKFMNVQFREVSAGQNLQNSQTLGFCMDFLNHTEGGGFLLGFPPFPFVQCTYTVSEL